MTTLTLTNVFDVQQLTSQVDMLQWQEGLDYVLAATTSEVEHYLLEEYMFDLTMS